MAQNERGGIFSYYTGLFLPKHDAAKRLDRFFIDVHHATWLNRPPGIQQKPWSHAIHINRLLDIPIGKSPFAFAIGPGISIINIHNNGRYSPITDTLGKVLYSQFTPWDSNQKWLRNKTFSNIVYCAGEIRFRTRHKKRFRFYTGGLVGWQFNVNQLSQGSQGKFREYNIKHLERLQYGLTAKVGWHRITFSGNYMLTGMFRTNKGQDLQMVTFGMTLYVF